MESNCRSTLKLESSQKDFLFSQSQSRKTFKNFFGETSKKVLLEKDLYFQEPSLQRTNKLQNLSQQFELIREYQQALLDYQQNQFTQTSSHFIQSLLKHTKLHAISSQFPLLYLMHTVIQKFMFNDLEVVFFVYFLEQNNWKYEQVCNYAKYAPNWFSFQNEILENDNYQALTLYLIFCAYTIKKYLNTMGDMSMYNAFLNLDIPEFHDIYINWLQYDHNNKFSNINPVLLNKVFKKYGIQDFKQDGPPIDYNSLVDQIIQISPPNKTTKNQGVECLLEEQIFKKLEYQVKQEKLEKEEQQPMQFNNSRMAKSKIKEQEKRIQKLEHEIKFQKKSSIKQKQKEQNVTLNQNIQLISQPIILDKSFTNEFIKKASFQSDKKSDFKLYQNINNEQQQQQQQQSGQINQSKVLNQWQLAGLNNQQIDDENFLLTKLQSITSFFQGENQLNLDLQNIKQNSNCDQMFANFDLLKTNCSKNNDILAPLENQKSISQFLGTQQQQQQSKFEFN